MSNITNVTDLSFKSEVIESSKPTIVDFWAPWCMPCRMMAPILEELAEKSDGKYKICKVNTDENFQAATQYKIMSIPSLVFFKDGQEVSRMIGVRSLGQIQAELDKLG